MKTLLLTSLLLSPLVSAGELTPEEQYFEEMHSLRQQQNDAMQATPLLRKGRQDWIIEKNLVRTGDTGFGEVIVVCGDNSGEVVPVFWFETEIEPIYHIEAKVGLVSYDFQVDDFDFTASGLHEDMKAGSTVTIRIWDWTGYRELVYSLKGFTYASTSLENC